MSRRKQASSAFVCLHVRGFRYLYKENNEEIEVGYPSELLEEILWDEIPYRVLWETGKKKKSVLRYRRRQMQVNCCALWPVVIKCTNPSFKADKTGRSSLRRPAEWLGKGGCLHNAPHQLLTVLFSVYDLLCSGVSREQQTQEKGRCSASCLLLKTSFHGALLTL